MAESYGLSTFNKMRHQRFPLPDKNGFFTISENNDCEYVNPIEWFRDAIVASTGQNTFNLLMLGLQSKEPPVIPVGWEPIDYLREVAVYNAKKTWNRELEQIKATKVPEPMFQILLAKTKKEQQKALKSLTVSGEELIAFYCRAFTKFGFRFSNYTFEFLPSGTDEMQMPGLAYIEKDKKVTVIGNTPYSEKQLKQVIDHRRRRIVRILDNDQQWHCIFYDYRSMNGQETDSQGPHVHYVSDKWGLTREQVLESLSRKQYTVPSLHIGFVRKDDQDFADSEN